MTGSPKTHSLLLHRLFEAMAARQPDATALVEGSLSISYGELDRRANAVAHRLVGFGAGPEKKVAVLVGRSIDYAVAVLGILKTGAAFVPIDSEWPAERRAFILSDSGACACISAGRETIAPPRMARLDLREDAHLLAQLPSESAPSAATSPDTLAYVIYTSGSTGQPKGVLIEHRAISTHIASIAGVYGLTYDDRSLFFHSTAFDPAIEQLFAPLVTGGTAVLRGSGLWNGHDFASFVAENKLTVATLPAAYWLQIVREWDAAGIRAPIGELRQVIVGGEALPPAAVELWRRIAAPSIRLLNDYGPTECTITATTHEIPPESTSAELDGRIPIGRPHGPVRILLLDADGRPSAEGAAGELCIGGPTLARGYLGRDDLTQEKFTPHPFNPGVRIYRTGDLARYNADGTLDFLGRLDDQVKIRGFRVELNEIETALATYENVAHAAVVAVDKGDADRHLAAIVVPQTGAAIDLALLRRHLASRLPHAVVPSTIEIIESLPLTTNGKIDRKELAARFARPAARPVSVVPRPATTLEETVSSAWIAHLGIETLAADDSVFEHGATSLTVGRMHQHLQGALDRTFSITLLFQHPTVRTLSAALAPPAVPSMTAAIIRARKQREMRERKRPTLSAP